MIQPRKVKHKTAGDARRVAPADARRYPCLTMTSQPNDFSRQIAQFAAGVARDEIAIPPAVTDLSIDMMLNAAAAALAGAAHPDGIAIARVVREMGGNGRSTIIGMGQRTSPVYAALVNGALVRMLDYDDNTVDTGGRPTAAVFPAVMALGEMHGYTGHATLAAFSAGCEVVARLSAAPETRAYAGSVGAAAASGMLMGRDESGLANAVALAAGVGNTGVGYMAPGASALAGGWAAMHGVMAALMAREEVAAPLGADAPNPDVLADLGRHWRLSDPGITIRLYPCHPASHCVIDAALGLAQLHRFEPSQIAGVHVGVTADTLEQLPYVLPEDGWQARGCLAFIAAATLCHGPPLINFFSDVAVQDEGVRGMMERVSVEATLPASPLSLHPAEVAVSLADGRTLRHRIDHPRGSPAMPLDAEELEAKFLYCTRYILPSDHIEEAIDSFRGIAEIENVTGMASVLGG